MHCVCEHYYIGETETDQDKDMVDVESCMDGSPTSCASSTWTTTSPTWNLDDYEVKYDTAQCNRSLCATWKTDQSMKMSSVKTHFNVADVGTKGLGRLKHLSMCFLLGLSDGENIVGEHEFQELNKQEVLKQQNKKVVRHVHLGASATRDLLLWSLLATARAQVDGRSEHQPTSSALSWTSLVVAFVVILVAWMATRSNGNGDGRDGDRDDKEPRGDPPVADEVDDPTTPPKRRRIRDYDDWVGSPYEETDEEPLPDGYSGRYPEPDSARAQPGGDEPEDDGDDDAFYEEEEMRSVSDAGSGLVTRSTSRPVSRFERKTTNRSPTWRR